MRESVLLAPWDWQHSTMALAEAGVIFTLLDACQCTLLAILGYEGLQVLQCRILQSNLNQALLLQHDMMLHCVSNRKLCFSAKCWSSPLPSRHSSSSTLLITTSTARTTSTYFCFFIVLEYLKYKRLF